MKRTIFLYVLVSHCLFAAAQGTSLSFHLTDTTFTQGAELTTSVPLSVAEGHDLIRPEEQTSLDSIALFMKKHPELIFEIASYTDQRGSDSFNLKLSQTWSNKVEKYLVEQGVSSGQVAAVGYGEDYPINTQATIDATDDKAEKEKLYHQNKRIEYRILYIYRSGIFSLTDAVFDSNATTMRFPVLFDLGKPTLRPEGVLLVDSLAKFLIAHPGMIIEVGNHMDMRASNASCSKPTQARANSIVDRLILDGVPRTQVVAKGFGETHPLITEKYIVARKSKEGREELYRLNRRTEIRILTVQ